MGNISKEERARRAALAGQGAQVEVAEQNKEPAATEDTGQDLTGLIKVSKGGETLHVHPCALLQHKQLGWREA